MPFVRISLLRGKPPAYLTALADSIHRALVDAFDVPKADKFVVIHQHEPGELIFDRDYLAGPRSDDFVLFAIQAGRPRSEETRQRFFAHAAELLAEAPGLRPEDVMVVISTSEPGEWSFGNGEAQMLDPDWRKRITP